MFLLNLFQPGSLRRHFSRSVFALCVLICLSAALLLTGCPIDDDDSGWEGLNPILIGIWERTDEWETERITVTSTHHFSVKSDWHSWSGSIVYAFNFDETSGIIIIKYDEGNEVQWFDGSNGWENAPPMDRTGDYYGVYFINLTPTSVVFLPTSDQSNYFGPTETTSRQKAIDRFTLDNRSDWIIDGALMTSFRVTED